MDSTALKLRHHVTSKRDVALTHMHSILTVLWHDNDRCTVLKYSEVSVRAIGNTTVSLTSCWSFESFEEYLWIWVVWRLSWGSTHALDGKSLHCSTLRALVNRDPLTSNYQCSLRKWYGLKCTSKSLSRCHMCMFKRHQADCDHEKTSCDNCFLGSSSESPSIQILSR